jgi:hypothetical protein
VPCAKIEINCGKQNLIIDYVSTYQRQNRDPVARPCKQVEKAIGLDAETQGGSASEKMKEDESIASNTP